MGATFLASNVRISHLAKLRKLRPTMPPWTRRSEAKYSSHSGSRPKSGRSEGRVRIGRPVQPWNTNPAVRSFLSTSVPFARIRGVRVPAPVLQANERASTAYWHGCELESSTRPWNQTQPWTRQRIPIRLLSTQIRPYVKGVIRRND